MSANDGRSHQKLRSILQLREMILAGELKAGERVAEVPLAAKLGVSRTPLRTALMALEHEGLLRSLPTGGFVVRNFGPRDIADSIELRGVMEGTAARLAAEKTQSPEALRHLVDLVDAMAPLVGLGPAAEGAFERYVALNAEFHDFMVELADSGVLRTAMDQILAMPFASPNAFLKVQMELNDSREILFLAQQQHRAIAEAIANREGSRAEAMAREHARLAQRNLAMAIDNRDMLQSLPGASLIRFDSKKKARKHAS
jgi:GntR family transcriptional regulator of vanillate catabolism